MISSKKDNYSPTDQGVLETWDYETSLTLKKEDCGDWDWPKYAAEASFPFRVGNVTK